MVVGSIAVTPTQIPILQMEGVKDSKRLNQQQIQKIFHKIKKNQITQSYVEVQCKRFNELYDDFKNAGTYELNFDANHLSSGVYLCRLKSDDTIIFHKMLMVK